MLVFANIDSYIFLLQGLRCCAPLACPNVMKRCVYHLRDSVMEYPIVREVLMRRYKHVAVSHSFQTNCTYMHYYNTCMHVNFIPACETGTVLCSLDPSNICVNNTAMCDGAVDCPNGIDESNFFCSKFIIWVFIVLSHDLQLIKK